jgi:hypothetical protein
VATRKRRSTPADVFVDFREMREREKAYGAMLIRLTQQEWQSTERTAQEVGLPASHHRRSLHWTALRSLYKEVGA